jgi:hypothetical protein
LEREGCTVGEGGELKLCHRRGRGAPLEREGSSNYAVEEGEVHLQIEEGTSNHTIQRILERCTVGEGGELKLCRRRGRGAPPDRRGDLEPHHPENIATILSANYYNYF